MRAAITSAFRYVFVTSWLINLTFMNPCIVIQLRK